MHRNALFVLVLACFLSSTLSAPCSGRLFYQTESSNEISWADVSTTTLGFAPNTGSALESSSECIGGIASFADVLCCPIANDIRCWNTSIENSTHYDLGHGLPPGITSPYSLRINLDIKKLLIGSNNRVHLLSFTNFWNDGTGQWSALASTSGRGWNLLSLATGPFYHLLYGSDSKIVRFNAVPLEVTQVLPTTAGVPLATVNSVAAIGNESWAITGSLGTLFRWIEDGTANPAPSVAVPTTDTYAGYNLSSADSVGNCPYFLLYNPYGSVIFASSVTASASIVPGVLSGSIAKIAFAQSPPGFVIPPLEDVVPLVRPIPFIPVPTTEAIPESPPTVTAVEPTAPAPPPIDCTSRRPEPKDSFTCINGTWTANASLSAPQVTVSSPIVIASNFTANNVTYIGINSSITVYGCANINGTLNVELTAEDVRRLNKTAVALLTSFGCINSTNFSLIPINVKGPTQGCDKISYSTKQEGSSTTTSLVLIMGIERNPCKSNRNAIIIGTSVSAGVVLLAAVGLAIAASCSSSVRTIFRPYSKKRTY